MKTQIKLEVTMSVMKNQITCPGQQGTRKWENQTRTKWKFMKDKTDKNQTSKELFWYKKNENQTRIKDKIIFFSAVLLGVFQCSHLKKCPDEEGYGVHGGHCRQAVISRHLQLGPHGAESPAQTSTHYFTCCNVYKPITGKVIHINTKYHTSTTILILEIPFLWVG